MPVTARANLKAILTTVPISSSNIYPAGILIKLLLTPDLLLIQTSNNVNLVTRHWGPEQDYPFPDF